MSLKIAIQMDDIDSINIESDSTFILALEAQKRGYKIFYYMPWQLSLYKNQVIANATEITLYDNKDAYYKLGENIILDLQDVDVVLMRQDPPFDMNYITYTYLLERISDKTLVINNPAEVRNSPEKIFATLFHDLMPPTLISRDTAIMQEFYNEHKDIIIKPLHAFGGQDIHRIGENSDNFQELAKNLCDKYNEPIMLQSFLPQVIEGDKRIILIDGEFAGAILRVPKSGDIRSNLACGGTAVKTQLTAKEAEICDILSPKLRRKGLMLTGIDVIGGYLTEINVTSPTGIRAINKLNETCLEAIFWDKVESKL
ncbi:glutathione synthase [Rickettsiales bacterium]|nr:glutathione synthase [Rickettsiales bacterium]